MARYFNPSKDELLLLRERDFGEVLNDSISFLKLQGKNFYRVLIFTVLPIALLYGIFVGLFMSNTNDLMSSILEGGNTDPMAPLGILTSWSYLGTIAIGIVENMVILTVVYSFIKLFQKGEREFKVVTVWEEARKHLLRTFGGIIFLTIIIVLLFGLAGLFIGVVASALGGGGGFFISFVIIILVLIGAVYAGVAFSMMVPSIVIENRGSFSSISRSTNLVSQSWGQTFLVLLVAYIALGLVASVFNAPSAFLQWFTALNSIESGGQASTSAWMEFLLIFGACLSAVGGALTSPIIHVIVSMQYFNLVERQDGLGMQALIETFGQKQSPADEDDEEDY